jgi:hypothetical protein
MRPTNFTPLAALPQWLRGGQHLSANCPRTSALSAHQSFLRRSVLDEPELGPFGAENDEAIGRYSFEARRLAIDFRWLRSVRS